MGRTDQPDLGSTSRKPSLRSLKSASRTGVRLTPRRWPSSASEKRSPGTRLKSFISALSWA